MIQSATLIEAIDGVAQALGAIAESLDRLGLNGATTPFGALELLAKEIKDGAEAIALSIAAKE